MNIILYPLAKKLVRSSTPCMLLEELDRKKVSSAKVTAVMHMGPMKNLKFELFRAIRQGFIYAL